MKTLIDYKLWQKGKRVYFQIIKMDESLRANDGVCFSIEIKNMQIESYDYPKLFKNAIFIRGLYKEFDKDIIYLAFKTIKEAEEYYNKAKKSLSLFCKYGFDYKEEKAKE